MVIIQSTNCIIAANDMQEIHSTTMIDWSQEPKIRRRKKPSKSEDIMASIMKEVYQEIHK